MRTLEEIKKAIKENFIANSTIKELYGLSPGKTFEEQFSSVSIEGLLIYIVAMAIYAHERIVFIKAEELESRIASEYPFSMSWYYNKALAFQLGDELQFNDSTYKFAYPVIDDSKQIVKNVAVRQLIGDGITRLRIYVAKENKEPLAEDELEAFKRYINQISAAGTHLEFKSSVPDPLRLKYIVYYNPQALSHTGELLSGSGHPVEDAVRSYLDNIRYGGTFNRTKSMDAIRAVQGVVDVVLGEVHHKDQKKEAQSFESESGFFFAEDINIIYNPGLHES